MKSEVVSYSGITSALILLFLLCAGCSTRRNTVVTRAYHELTTRYNIYHNAEQAYREILEEQSHNSIDRYDSLLTLYPWVVPDGDSFPGGPFDGVVEKTSKAIRQHSITAKPRRNPAKRLSTEQRSWLQQEEYNPFLHNVWMLLGKAHLQNGDLEEALAVFSYIGRIYRQNREIANEAAIWMLRCYTEQNRLYQAEQSARALLTINLLDQQQQLFEETYTGYLLKGGQYHAAIPRLKRVIKNEKERYKKQRLQYLLGQLLQITGEEEEAYRAFEAVKGLSTPFHLKLQATASQLPLAPRGKQRQIMRALERMKPGANEAQRMHIERVLAGTSPKGAADATAMRVSEPITVVANDSLIQLSQQHDSLYQVVYHAFMRGDTSKVVAAATLFAEQFPASAWLPQLRQMQSITQSGRMPADSPPGNAWETLSEDVVTREQAGDPHFLAERQGPHLFLFAFDKGTTDRNSLLFATAAFNFSTFRLRTFDLSFLSLGIRDALSVSIFHSFDDAYQYGEMLLSDSLFATNNAAGMIPLVISEENADRLRRNGKLEEYLSFQERNLTDVPLHYLTPTTEESTISGEQLHKKIVPLDTIQSNAIEPDDEPVTLPADHTMRLTPAEQMQMLEQNAREAMMQSQEQRDSKSREEQLKERERLREERIRQRQKELKERAQRREEQIREREKEREQKNRKR